MYTWWLFLINPHKTFKTVKSDSTVKQCNQAVQSNSVIKQYNQTV